MLWVWLGRGSTWLWLGLLALSLLRLVSWSWGLGPPPLLGWPLATAALAALALHRSLRQLRADQQLRSRTFFGPHAVPAGAALAGLLVACLAIGSWLPAVGCAAAIGALLLTHVRLDGTGVRIRNLHRVHQVAWPEVAAVRTAERDRQEYLVIQRPDGREVPAWALIKKRDAGPRAERYFLTVLIELARARSAGARPR